MLLRGLLFLHRLNVRVVIGRRGRAFRISDRATSHSGTAWLRIVTDHLVPARSGGTIHTLPTRSISDSNAPGHRAVRAGRQKLVNSSALALNPAPSRSFRHERRQRVVRKRRMMAERA